MEAVLVSTCFINVTHNCHHSYEVIPITSLYCVWLSSSSKARQVPRYMLCPQQVTWPDEHWILRMLSGWTDG